MSEQAGPTRACPTCGNTVPASARYCPSCGTRLNPTTPYSEDDFEDALADVLGEPEVDPAETVPASSAPVDEPPATEPPIVSSPSAADTEWTASASDWTNSRAESPSGTWSATPTVTTTPIKQGRGRTFWIILAIVGFLIFCCCGLAFVLLLFGGTMSVEESSGLITIRAMVK